MMETFSFKHESSGNCDYFRFSGNIDINAETVLHDIPDSVAHPCVVMDFGQAGRINSLGIALLLKCMKKIREVKKADITICGLSPVNAMLFKITGVFLLASQE